MLEQYRRADPRACNRIFKKSPSIAPVGWVSRAHAGRNPPSRARPDADVRSLRHASPGTRRTAGRRCFAILPVRRVSRANAGRHAPSRANGPCLRNFVVPAWHRRAWLCRALIVPLRHPGKKTAPDPIRLRRGRRLFPPRRDHPQQDLEHEQDRLLHRPVQPPARRFRRDRCAQFRQPVAAALGGEGMWVAHARIDSTNLTNGQGIISILTVL